MPHRANGNTAKHEIYPKVLVQR